MHSKKASSHLDWIMAFFLFLSFLVSLMYIIIPGLVDRESVYASKGTQLIESLSENVYTQNLFVYDPFEHKYAVLEKEDFGVMNAYNLVDGENIWNYKIIDDLIVVEKPEIYFFPFQKISNPFYTYEKESSVDVNHNIDEISSSETKVNATEDLLTYQINNYRISFTENIINKTFSTNQTNFFAYLKRNSSDFYYKEYTFIDDTSNIQTISYLSPFAQNTIRELDYTYEIDSSESISEISVNDNILSTDYLNEEFINDTYNIKIDDLKFVFAGIKGTDYFNFTLNKTNETHVSLNFKFQLTFEAKIRLYLSDFNFQYNYDEDTRIFKGFFEKTPSLSLEEEYYYSLNENDLKSELNNNFGFLLWEGSKSSSFDLQNSPLIKYIPFSSTNANFYLNDRIEKTVIDKYGNEQIITLHTIFW